jgi:hypothetical protein
VGGGERRRIAKSARVERGAASDAVGVAPRSAPGRREVGERRVRRRPTWKAMVSWRSEDQGPRASL